MLWGHGDETIQNLKINFSSNVWYNANISGLHAHLSKNLQVIRNYPQVIPQELNNKIAEHHKTDPSNVLVTNGATEAIYLVAQAYSGSETTIIYPTFSEYSDACTIYNHFIHYIQEKDFTHSNLPKKGLVFICNPNNPTGKTYPFFYIEKLLHKNPHLNFINDEAYSDFTLTLSSAVQLIDKYTNLIILKSLTKSFCIPGIRLGYILAGADIISKIKTFKMPWSVNSLAILSGEYLFTHISDFIIPLKTWIDETQWLIEQISQIPGFECKETDTSFFLCKTNIIDAANLKSFLLKEMQILIRDASNFKGLEAGNFRICTQSHENNLKLIDALWNRTTQL
jgi:threonine-phosphate decarboxylase